MPELIIRPGLSLHYIDENPQGRSTTLLLHGLGATSDSWALQMPALIGAGFRVLAPDLRGFGRSTYPGGGYRIEDLAEDMVCLLRAVSVNKVSVVGISLGGTVALSLVCDYAQLMDRVMLVNTFARLRPTNPSSLFYYALRFALIYTLGMKTQAKAVAHRIFPRPDQEELRSLLIAEIAQADPSGYRAAFSALARFDRRTCLSGIAVPTLVVTAAGDTTVPVQIQRRLATGISGASQAFIPDAGHAVTIDQPEAFNKIMLDFLSSGQSDRF